MLQSDLEIKKDKRLLVLFLFGFILLFMDYIPFQKAVYLENRVGDGREDTVSTGATVPEVLSPRLAFFYNQPMAINHASLQDLTLIPGVGEQTAFKIVNFRDRYGYVMSTEDLERIPGIGKKMSTRISEFVSFVHKP